MGLDQFLFFRKKVTDPIKVNASIMEDIKALAEFKKEILDDIEDDDARRFRVEVALNDFINIVEKKIETGAIDEDEKLMDWGRAYEIREWFADNTGYPVISMYDHPVTREHLEQLYDDLSAVLAIKSDFLNKKPGAIEAIQERFSAFDGDKAFFIEAEVTVDALNSILDNSDYYDGKGEFIYYEWW